MNALKTDIKRALLSWGFPVGIIGMAVAAFFGAFEQMLPVFQGQVEEGLQQGFTIQLVFTALGSDIVLMVLPILCALPFTTAFVDDFKSKYIREYLPRCGKRDYVRGKVIATTLSGGLTLFLGILLVLVVFAVMFLPMEVPPEVPEMSEYEMQMARMMGDAAQQADTLTAQLNFAQLMQTAFVFFLSGCLWSLVGSLMATLTMSRYMAYAAPFIFYYVLVILSQRYLKDFYVLDPQEWLRPANVWVGGTCGIALFVGEIMVIVAFLFAWIMRRRLNDA